MLDCMFDVFWCHLIFLIVLQPNAFSELSLLLTTCQYHHLAAGGNRKNQKLEQYLENDRKAGNLWNAATPFPVGWNSNGLGSGRTRFVSHRSMLRFGSEKRIWSRLAIPQKNKKKQGWYTKTIKDKLPRFWDINCQLPNVHCQRDRVEGSSISLLLGRHDQVWDADVSRLIRPDNWDLSIGETYEGLLLLMS